MSFIASNGSKPSSSSSAGWTSLPPEYAIPEQAPSELEAREYCRRLARRHYENFSVVTCFLPEQLRQHFFNVYAYCRISDDLGDEVGDAAASLRLLDEWEAELDACYAGCPRHVRRDRESSGNSVEYAKWLYVAAIRKSCQSEDSL